MHIKRHQKGISIFLIWLMLFSLFTSVSPAFAANSNKDEIKSPIVDKTGNVTFQAVHDGDQLYVVGSMNDWDVGNGIKMERKNDIFTTTSHLHPGTYEYKLVKGNSWANGEFFRPAQPTTKKW
ncbi:hypothetical protein [Paracerasibacillus soli]|uniref:CBM20 domain-containing protein n=1 Tax=Paracerasibacillus soli TaxID=480284 RepID=A0ABU5CS75_9BACI|nr:hypothetical protein [Virgibacillus soli]MDY0409218.1 hypothetical protein [Virgibacillus soli]